MGNVPLPSETNQKTYFRPFSTVRLTYSSLWDDESGTILNINKAVKRILHYQSQDIVGKHYSILYPPEYEKPREDFLDEITVYGSVLEGGRLVKADGTLLPVELTATMIPWDSGEAILVTFRDMSDREQAQQSLRESEEKYRHLAELLPGIVFRDRPEQGVHLCQPERTGSLGLSCR